MTRLRDSHVKRFRARNRGPGPQDNHGPVLFPGFAARLREPEGARAVCLHCGDGGAADQLILCDGEGCENVSYNKPRLRRKGGRAHRTAAACEWTDGLVCMYVCLLRLS